MGGPTATFIRLLKSYEYAVGIKAGTDLSNSPYFIKMEQHPEALVIKK